VQTPEHWTWRDGPVDPGPAVVVDIDGVLSDAVSRQHYIESPRRDWRAFFDACGDDPVIEEVKVLLDLLDPALHVVLLTARPERVHHLTEAWLGHYGIRWDLLIMRPWGDYDMARYFKQSTAADKVIDPAPPPTSIALADVPMLLPAPVTLTITVPSLLMSVAASLSRTDPAVSARIPLPLPRFKSRAVRPSVSTTTKPPLPAVVLTESESTLV
jgi:hypothetical protein